MKNGKSTVEVVRGLLEPLIAEQKLILWDVRFEKEGSMWLLRVIIDKEGFVDINDCERLSRPLDKLLDEVDPIEQSYCLEVSSAGLERELKQEWHFDKSIGQKVQAKLIRPKDGEREFIGILKASAKEQLTIETENGEQVLNKSELAYVKWYAEI